VFFDGSNPKIVANSKGKKRKPGSKPLAAALKTQDEQFLDFVSRCLIWDPEKRMKPDEALQHPFITDVNYLKPF
jgi:dual specificity tyrosine-phosphorylation-regulated kinase 2/3/4